MSKTALYSGSFNPIHIGHLDIILRAAIQFDNVIVVVANNSDKRYSVSAEERANMVRLAITNNFNFPNNIEVIVLPDNQSIVDFAIREEVDVIIRGIRNSTDLDYENTMAYVNREEGIETFYLPSNPKYICISSSMVRECVKHKLSITQYVPLSLITLIKEYYG